MLDAPTPVATPDGWTTAEKLRSGTLVLTSTGAERLSATWRAHGDVGFELVCSDTGVLRVDAGHSFELSGPHEGLRADTRTLRQMMDEQGHSTRSLRIPNPGRSEWPVALQPHDGYLVGQRVGQRRDIPLPPVYRRGTLAQRMAVLRGLMEAGGTWNPSRRRCSLIFRHPETADTVLELLCGLGLSVQFSLDGNHLRMEWTPPFNPFGDREVECRTTATSTSRTIEAVRRVRLSGLLVGARTPSGARLLAGPTMMAC